MTEQEKRIKRYMNEIDRRLRLPLALKARINTDLGTDLHARLEAGQSLDEIMAEMGSPEQVAAGFNRELGTPNKRSPWRLAFLAVAVVLLCYLVLQGIAVAELLHPQDASSTAIIGGADGPTAIYVAGELSTPSIYSALRALGLLLGCVGGYLLLRGQSKKETATALWVAALGLLAEALRIGRDLWMFLELCKLAELPQSQFGIWLLTVLSQLLYPSFWLPLGVLLVALRRKHREKAELKEEI